MSKVVEEGPEWYNERMPSMKLNPFWQKMYAKVLELLPVDFGVAIAELGCGPGRFAKLLQANGYRNYWGVDFSEVCVERAMKYVPGFRFTVGSLYDNAVQKEFGKYDVFILLQVLEHLSNDVSVLSAIPPGRKVIFSIPTVGGRGHVLVLRKAEQVWRRYEKIIAFEDVLTLKRTTGYFLLGHGVRI